MTEEQIAETLGTKVMGWSKEQVDFLYPAWNPLQNIADAWQVVEKFKTLRVTNYLAYLVFYESIPSSIYARTPRTICDAALDALNVVD